MYYLLECGDIFPKYNLKDSKTVKKNKFHNFKKQTNMT